jgi:type IV pilus assembly protein PilM
MQLLEKWINPVQNGLVGLDIGSGSVKLLGLRTSSSGWSATCAAWSQIEPTEDKAQRYAYTLKAVQNCFSEVPAHFSHYAVCGLSGPDAAVRSFSFPKMPEHETEKAVRFEAQQVCPMDMRHSVLDYQLIQSHGEVEESQKKQSGILVAGTEQAIGERCRLVKEAGGKTVLMDAAGLAALNCLSGLENIDNYRTVALIDIGRLFTNVIVLGANGLPFVRDLTAGSQTLIQQVCQTSGRDEKTLREILWANSGEPIPGDVLTAVYQAARPLIMSINETLKFYANHEKGAFAEKVFLCGGMATVRPLVELLSEALPTDVSVFNPFQTIHVDAAITGADVLKTNGPAFVVAAGLAMRTV